MYELFKTRRKEKGRPKAGSWTQVVLKVRDACTGKFTGEEAVVTSFGGSDGGLAPAKQLADLLNTAYEDFHNGRTSSSPLPVSQEPQ